MHYREKTANTLRKVKENVPSAINASTYTLFRTAAYVMLVHHQEVVEEMEETAETISASSR